jgi:hypothetical protein
VKNVILLTEDKDLLHVVNACDMDGLEPMIASLTTRNSNRLIINVDSVRVTV